MMAEGKRSIIVPDIRYLKPKKSSDLTEKLKYITFRDDREDANYPGNNYKQGRWVDRGMGSNWRAVREHCHDLQSKHVLAWSMVISPDPTLFNLMPQEIRAKVMVELVDNVINEYYAARDESPPEYSFVVHNALTHPDEKPEGKDPFTHAHIVLPGTVADPDHDDARLPFYNNDDRGHIQMMHDISEQELSFILDRELTQERNIDWRALADRIVEEPALPLDPEIEYELEGFQPPSQLHEQSPIIPDHDDLEAWFPRLKPESAEPSITEDTVVVGDEEALDDLELDDFELGYDFDIGSFDRSLDDDDWPFDD